MCGLALAGPFDACPSCDTGAQWADEDEGFSAHEGDAVELEDAETGEVLDDARSAGEEQVSVSAPKKRRGCPPGGWPKKPKPASPVATEVGGSSKVPPVDDAVLHNFEEASSVGRRVRRMASTFLAELPTIRPTRMEESPVFQEMVKEWERLEADIGRMRERQNFLKELAHRAGVQFERNKELA